MKISIITTALVLASTPALRADDMASMNMSPAPVPSFSVSVLEKQSSDLNAAIKARDVHPIHKIDHAVADEVMAWQKNGPVLAADEKQNFNDSLADMSKQAHRAHLDAHASKWEDAAVAQQQFVADLKAIKALMPDAK